jgi:hypothetical protein
MRAGGARTHEPARSAGVSPASRLRGHDALAPRRNATVTPGRRAGVSPACAPEARAPGADLLTGVDFLVSPCVPSPVSGIRTPKLPLLPLWEKGVGGMRGKGAQECRTSRISPKNSTLERSRPRGRPASHKLSLAPQTHARKCRLPFQASGRPDSPFSPCGRRRLGG